MADLLEHLANWRPFKAVVVGDFMLDELVYGDAERLSPDAPVPVLQVERIDRRAGGAANVCMDLAAIGATVHAIGVTGDDATGDLLRDELQSPSINVDGVISDDGRPTTVKRSLIGLAQHRHPQKMFRLDMESRAPLGAAAVASLLERFDAAVANADVVCLEDYGKGVCTPEVCREVIARAKALQVPVIVDPARLEDFSRYAGASCLTPNRSEALGVAKSLGLAEDVNVEQLGAALHASLDLDALVLTLDRDGALLIERDSPPVQIPTVAREVYDVTGAGDMVLAALAGALAQGASWPDATRFANVAAGLEVEVFGVQPIPLERIHHAVLQEAGSLRGKRRTLDELMLEVTVHRGEGRRIVFTNGCFDIIHAGHISLLRQAATFGDVLIVGVNSDDSVRRLKGPERPVHHEDDRVDVLSEFESVTAVVVFDDDTPMEIIRAVKPDVLVKGADYEKREVVGADVVEAAGGRVELVPLMTGRSTSAAIDRIRAT